MMNSKSRRAAARTRAHNKIVAEMIAGGEQAAAIMRGEADPSTYRVHRVHLPAELDVKAVRKKTGLSQEAFAGAFGFSPGTVRDWEQRRNAPDQAARAYLYVIWQKPGMVLDVLSPLRTEDNIVGKDASLKVVRQEAVDAKSIGTKRRSKIAPTHARAKISAHRAARSH